MENPKRFISGIDFIVSNSSVKTENTDIVLQDLNQGSSGKYIYPMKSWTNDPALAITSFAFTHNDPPLGYTKLAQDLNEGAKGTFNHLCFRR